MISFDLSLDNFFLMGGLALILALFVGKTTHWMKITGVVGYLVTGVVLGPQILGFIELSSSETELITWFALGFVGFTIGGKMPFSIFKRSGKKIMLIMAGGILLPFILVLAGVYLLEGSISLGLIFGALACTSAPAGTIAVIYEYRARGSLTDAIIAVVGLDDAFGVVVFGITMAAVTAMIGDSSSISTAETVWGPVREIMGGLLLGGLIGGMLSYLVKKIHDRTELFTITIALLLICIGTAIWLEISVILACITMGMIFVNVLHHECRIVFRDVEKMALPVFIIFFVTAGMELRWGVLKGSGMLVVVYVLFRTAGKILGPQIAAKGAGAEDKIQRFIGFGILPQAGVALGLALLASHKLEALGREDLASLVITTITATTIVFEIIGPIGARFALMRSGEARKR